MNIKNKIAIVTGGGRGIGAAIALKLAEYGADVVVADLDAQTAESTSEQISGQYDVRSLAMQIDVTDLDQTKRLVSDTISQLGGLDILVNNVGWDDAQKFWETSPEFWNKVIDINLRGPLNCCFSAIHHMIEKGSGKIVSIASDAGRVGSSGETVYSGCKGGVIAMTKSLAREVARYQINVNSVCPGPTDTPGHVEQTTPKLREALKRAIPFGRVATPEEIANAVLFFASPLSDFITGQVLSVSGGLTMVD